MIWAGIDIRDHLVPTFLPWAGKPSTRLGCLKIHPTWPETHPGMELNKLCQCLITLTAKNVFLISNLYPSSFIFKLLPLVLPWCAQAKIHSPFFINPPLSTFKFTFTTSLWVFWFCDSLTTTKSVVLPTFYIWWIQDIRKQCHAKIIIKYLWSI